MVQLGRHVGVNISSKTVLKNLREVGVVNPRIQHVGLWVKHRGSPRNWSWGKNVWKINLPDPLINIALSFNAWLYFMEHGGYFDLDAVVRGEKPP
ncbi:MAG: hypothetical protein QXV17_10345 [Candidatus Micrarchaeaceae archaeon]